MAIQKSPIPASRAALTSRSLAELRRRTATVERNPFIRKTSDVQIHGAAIGQGDDGKAALDVNVNASTIDAGTGGHTVSVNAPHANESHTATSTAKNGYASVAHQANADGANGDAALTHEANAQGKDGVASIQHTALATQETGSASIEHEAQANTSHVLMNAESTDGSKNASVKSIQSNDENGLTQVILSAQQVNQLISDLKEPTEGESTDGISENTSCTLTIDSAGTATLDGDLIITGILYLSQIQPMLTDDTHLIILDGNLDVDGDVSAQGSVTADTVNLKKPTATAPATAKTAAEPSAATVMGRATFTGNGTGLVRFDIPSPTGRADTNFVASPRGVWSGEVHADGLIDNGERLSIQATTAGRFTNGKKYQFSYMASTDE